MKRVFVKGGKLAFPQGLSDLQLLKEIKKSCHLLHCLLCERVGCSDPNQADFEVGKTIFEDLLFRTNPITIVPQESNQAQALHAIMCSFYG